jgi:hypothetical protein
MVRILAASLLTLALSSPALAQSQAINGTIEGTIFDDRVAFCRASPSPSPTSTQA